MLESKLLSAAVANRNHFDKINKYLDKKTLSPYGAMVLNEIGGYYKRDSKARDVDLEVLKPLCLEKEDKDKGSLVEYLSMLNDKDEGANVVHFICEQHKKTIAAQMAIAAGLGEMEKIARLSHKFQEIDVVSEEDEASRIFVAPSLEQVSSTMSADNLIPIYPKRLNELLGGGVPRQSQIGIVARPDVGKTTVAMNIAGVAAMAGFRVLYCGNEDPDSKMILRAYTRLLQMTEVEILNDPDTAYHMAMEKGLENFIFAGMEPGTLEEVAYLVDEYKPDVVVLDQLRNMKTQGSSGNMTEDLNVLATGTRSLAKSHDLVTVLITQAGDSAHNKLRLEYNDVEYSNTGFAAQLDLMIGVGQNPDLKQAGKIMLSFPKNKLVGPIEAFDASIVYEKNLVGTVKK